MCVCVKARKECQRTLVLINTHDNNDLVPAHADELLDRPDTAAGQLRKHDHALGIVVLEQIDVCAHLSNLAHLHHHHIVWIRQRLLVKPHRAPSVSCQRPRMRLVATSQNGPSSSGFLSDSTNVRPAALSPSSRAPDEPHRQKTALLLPPSGGINSAPPARPADAAALPWPPGPGRSRRPSIGIYPSPVASRYSTRPADASAQHTRRIQRDW